jgi:hypothetical protein
VFSRCILYCGNNGEHSWIVVYLSTRKVFCSHKCRKPHASMETQIWLSPTFQINQNIEICKDGIEELRKMVYLVVANLETIAWISQNQLQNFWTIVDFFSISKLIKVKSEIS